MGQVQNMSEFTANPDLPFLTLSERGGSVKVPPSSSKGGHVRAYVFPIPSLPGGT